MSQMKMLLCLLAGTFILLGFAIWNSSADYKVGDKVIIKDCTLWSEPVKLGANKSHQMGDGVSVAASEGVSMRSGFSIGERVGVITEIEVFRRNFVLHPDYRYKVEIQYEGRAQAEWYYDNGGERDISKYVQTTTQKAGE
jgi:hypothetical protein